MKTQYKYILVYTYFFYLSSLSQKQCNIHPFIINASNKIMRSQWIKQQRHAFQKSISETLIEIELFRNKNNTKREYANWKPAHQNFVAFAHVVFEIHGWWISLFKLERLCGFQSFVDYRTSTVNQNVLFVSPISIIQYNRFPRY